MNDNPLKSDAKIFRDRYLDTLRRYLENPRERYLLEASALGNEMVQAGVSLGKVTELHSSAINELDDSLDDSSVIQANQRTFALFNEVMLVYSGMMDKKNKELDKHRNHLEELIEERTGELIKERDSAKAANNAKSAFLANMSHEIRTPMTAIIGFAQLMQQSSPTPSQLEKLNKIDSSAVQLLGIIDDILDYSKIETGSLTLDQTDFRLATIFDHIHSLFTERVNNKGLTIETDFGQVTGWLWGDPVRLRQALLNYVNNALEFTEKGKISIRAKKLEQRGDNVLLRFEVQDTGIGIAPDKLADLFNGFTEVQAKSTRQRGGSGLGLIITQRLARLMGGEAGAKSTPGVGSTFWFTACLGMGEANEEAEATQQIGLRPDQLSSRILLVEDNAINRDVAIALLKSGGLEADTASNGLMAIPLVHDSNYDLVLMDVQMPVMDGLEATRIIRATPELEGLPILAMTANVFAEDRQACLAAGMNDFIAKPIDVDNMFSTLAKWLPGQDGPATANKPESADPPDQVIDPESPSGGHYEAIEEQAGNTYNPDNDSAIDPLALQSIFGNDQKAKHDILTKFIAQSSGVLKQIQKAYEQLNAELVSFHAHKLKSSARTVGANSLSDLCFDLEVAGRKEDWMAIDRLTAQMGPCMDRVQTRIDQM